MISKRLALVLLLVLAVGACGKGEDKPASSGDPTTSSTESSDATTPDAEDGEAAGPETTLEFVGTEYAYAAEGGDAAAPIPAGPVTVMLENAGAEEHQISIVRLKEGKTQQDFIALGEDLSQFDDVLETWGGPNGVAPGETNSTTQVLEAGDYFFVCFIPAPDGQPHVAKGMILPVTVEGELPPAEELPDESITLSDYSFGLGTVDEPASLASGVWRFTNDGPQAHEAVVYTAAEGSTMEDVLEFFSNPDAESAGPPPIVGAGGIGPIDAGRDVLDPLPPGEYVFLCFIPDAADGIPHFAKGMIEFATVE